jgi:hypothetical protein
VDEVCEHLAPDRIRALAIIVRIVRKSNKPLPSRGKDALMEKIRAAHRASRREIGNQ